VYKLLLYGILISSLCLNVMLTYELYGWNLDVNTSSKIGSSLMFKILTVSGILYKIPLVQNPMILKI